MTTERKTTIQGMKTTGTLALLLCAGLLAGCASSGDVEQARQESAQAKAKMSAELQQERQLAATMEKESEAKKAEAEKLAKAFGGKQSAAPLKATGSSMSLTTALSTNGCIKSFTANPANPTAQYTTALYIDGSTSCSNVTVGTSDATFTAQNPLRPVIIGSGGTLYLQDQPMTLYASSFLILNGGTMQAGNPGAHVQNKITIVMAGNSSAAPPPTTGDQNPNMRDITVMNGSTLALYGAKGLSGNPDNLNNNPSKSPAFINTVYGTKSWTYLAVPAGPSQVYNDTANVSAPVPTQNPDGTLLTLATTVDWQKNDWISVATTSFSSHQTEIVQICNVKPVTNPDPGYSPYPAISGVPQYTIPNVPTQVSQITLCPSTPLKHYHYGGLAPTPGFFPANTTQQVAPGGNPINVSYQARSFYDGSSRNYGIDERAEVALLSRNIKLTSVAGQSGDGNNFIGGHLVAMVSVGSTAWAPNLQLVGVEIEKFGQGLVGRYPVHLHKLPQYPITGAANAADGNIAITSATVPTNGTLVTISGVQGNTAANGQSWFVTNANSGAGTFELSGSRSNGTYTSGGVWTPATILIQDVSVHHSYNKCYVVHGTGNANFYNNACVRTVGQGFYLEDGSNITGNQFMRNLIAGTMGANTTYSYPQQNNSQYWDGDNLQGYHYSTTGKDWYQNPNWYNVNNVPDTSQSGLNTANPVDSTTPGGFWITNLGNTFVNNSVAGCQAQGRGYWLLTQGSTTTGYPEFTGNRVHGCYNGIDNDDITGNTPQMIAPMLTGGLNAPVLLLTDNTATRSRNAGTWLRSIYTTLHNNRFATNPHGVTILVGGGPEGTFPGFWGLVHQSVFAGMTRNNADRYPLCPQGGGNWTQECTDVNLQSYLGGWGAISIKMNIAGYSYYDGPARIEHNRFVNFRFDPSGIHPTDPAARLLTQADIAKITQYISLGQLEAPPSLCTPTCQTTTLFNGYVGDAATAWQQSNGQSVPPTQYIRDSIWDNVDFKHQVYTDDVNLGALNDGDKTTVIRDLDGQLAGMRVVSAANGQPAQDIVPISLNNLEYYATDFTVDEPHARGPNNFRASALMSPHKYATLNVESVTNPSGSWPTGYPLEIKRDMPNPDNTTYPGLYFYGRGQKPIYEPFVMDRMGYTLYAKTGAEHASPQGAAFQPQLLFSYTDPPVHQGGDFFVSRIAVYQPLQDSTKWTKINVSRIRRQWGGQPYGKFQPNFNPPGGAGTTCDNVFNLNQGSATTKWADCQARATNQSPYNAAPYTNLGYPYGIALTPAANWASFEQSYTNLLNGTTTVTDFIKNQTFYYDTATNLLYFYMIEDQPVQRLHAPYGTCGGGSGQYATNVATTQTIKSFSDKNSVKAALDASCLAGGGAWQPSPTQATPIKNVTLNTPIVITSTTVPLPGAKVTITGTNTPADGTWSVTVLNSTSFSLNNSQGSGSYTNGGTWSPLHSIAHATHTSPIVVTTTSPVPANGTQVVISGVQGNTAANGTWTVANANPAASTFALKGSIGNGAFVKYDPQPIDLFICGQIGCAAYLVDFGTNVATTFTPCTAPCAPPHPIKRSDYNKLNQYQLVYSTPTQQPNGLPVAANSAIGNTAPPQDGTPLSGVMAPIDGLPPSTGSGDQVNYLFMVIGGTPTQITQNFPYSCATTIPWSPVNARGSYPPSGGFASPLHDSVCDWVMPHPIAGVASSGGTTTITSVSANTSNTMILPPAGAQVVISGVSGLSSTPYAVTPAGTNSFSISGTAGSYTSGGTWQLLNSIASVANTTSSVTITVQNGAPVPGTGALVALAGIGGCTLPGTLTVASTTPSTSTAGGTFTINGTTGTCTATNATWQLKSSQ